MKIWKTTLVLICLSAGFTLEAQFQKGDWLLEGGFDTHLESSFGKKEIDLSQGGFSSTDLDGYGLNLSAGKFFRDRKELGLFFSEDWSRRTTDYVSLTPNQEIVRADKVITVAHSIGLYYRQYHDFGKGWFGGFQASLAGEREWYAYYEEDVLFSGYKHHRLKATGRLFVTKMIGKHFGGRVSFGNIGCSVEKRNYKEGIWYSSFDLDIRNLIQPAISVFWTFHGKSKNNRD